jgi:hypothetical protein
MPNADGRGGRVHFTKFENAKMNDCILFIKDLLKFQDQKISPSVIHATGGYVNLISSPILSYDL